MSLLREAGRDLNNELSSYDDGQRAEFDALARPVVSSLIDKVVLNVTIVEVIVAPTPVLWTSIFANTTLT